MSDIALPKIDLNDPLCVVCQNCAMVADHGDRRTVFWCNTCGSRVTVDVDEQGRLEQARWTYPTNAPFVPPVPEPKPPRWKPYVLPPDFWRWLDEHRAAGAAALRTYGPNCGGSCFIREDGDGAWLLRWPTIDFTTMHVPAQRDFWLNPEDENVPYMYLRSHPDRLKPTRK